MTAIETCRTAALGGHVEACDACGHQRIAYNSCANRHCPRCQSLKRAAWIDDRHEELLDVDALTSSSRCPRTWRPLPRRTRPPCQPLPVSGDRRDLTHHRADPGISVPSSGSLRCSTTWGQTLLAHPHLHCVIPGGGLSPDGTRWVACRREILLARAGALSPVPSPLPAAPRGRVRRRDPLPQGSLAPLQDRSTWMRALAGLRQTEWVVYAKRPWAGRNRSSTTSGATHRVAISNASPARHREREVGSPTTDYRADPPQSAKTMTPPPSNSFAAFCSSCPRASTASAITVPGRPPSPRKAGPLPTTARRPDVRSDLSATATPDYRDRVEALTGISLRVCPPVSEADHHRAAVARLSCGIRQSRYLMMITSTDRRRALPHSARPSPGRRVRLG